MVAPYPRSATLLQKRYQGFLVFISTFLQTVFVIHSPLMQPSSAEITIATGLGCLAAALAGIILIRGLGRYPGVEESSYIFPSLTVCYGCLMLVLLMLRIPYSRLLLASTFTINLALLSTLYAMLRRSTKLRIGVVPEGQYQQLISMQNVEWRILDCPQVPHRNIDAVSVDLGADLSGEWERRLATFALEGVPVYDLKHLKESLTGKVQIKHLSENNFGTLSPLRAWMTIKRIVDWLTALVATILLLPFWLIVAVFITIDSPGPVIFKQVRVGYRGKPFNVLKLRTMTAVREAARLDVSDEESMENLKAAVTQDGDQRITRVGRFLRQRRLDELPQLINILKGEMSWIGPRPEALVLSQWYEQEIPFYPYRHIVRPGISGWAQVHQGHVADVADVTEKLHFDFYYIKHFSLWIDLIVIGRTIRTIMTGFGAR